MTKDLFKLDSLWNSNEILFLWLERRGWECRFYTVEFFLNAKLKSNDNESRIFELVFNFHAFDKQKFPNEWNKVDFQAEGKLKLILKISDFGNGIFVNYVVHNHIVLSE